VTTITLSRRPKKSQTPQRRDPGIPSHLLCLV
jgi:hypothetical protein